MMVRSHRTISCSQSTSGLISSLAFCLVSVSPAGLCSCLDSRGDSTDIQTSTVHIDEVFSHEIPYEFRPSGASASSSGAFVVWSQSTSQALVFSQQLLIEIDIGLGMVPVGGQLLANGQAIELVDGENGRVVRYDTSGVVIGEYDIPQIGDSIRLEDASFTRLALYVGGRSPSSSYVVLKVVPPQFQLLAEFPGSSTEPRQFHLSAYGDHVLVTEQDPPFSTVVLGRGRSRDRIVPGQAAGLHSDSSSTSRYVSLPMIALDHGFIQTISNIKSDDRIILLFNKAGRFLRKHAIPVPMGFMAASVETQTVLAMRVTDRAELVLYEWRWGE